MARVCVNDIFFSVLPDGRLTLNAENLGPILPIVFNGAGSTTDFIKADFPTYAKFRVRVVGGGGGAGGSTAIAAESSSQGGGGGGGYAESFMTWSQLAAIETVTVGAGGAGGGGANDGAPGGPSSFGAWAVGNGGAGSVNAMTSGSTGATVQGAAGGTATSLTGGVAIRGGVGYPAIRLSAAANTSGKGGDTPLGYGGTGRSGTGNGLAGSIYGGGGGGSLANNASTTGGAGAGGVVVVEVFF